MTGKALICNREASDNWQRARVNVLSLANTAAIRTETRNGRECLIVPSATLPDDVVMNGIKYPATEIEASYASLNRTPAPYGHPQIGNAFVSARDPEGINIGHIGAWNENARREGGRVFLDKVIDVEVAGRSENGKAVLNAIEKGKPIHTSTGLLCNLEPAEEGEDHQWIARNIEFDHDAILLEEQGAATPEQGVGMLVNANGEQQEIKVINSALEMAERDLDWAAMSVVRALEERNRASFADRITAAIADIFGSERDTQTNGKDKAVAVTDEQFNTLSEQVKTLSESVATLGDTVTNAVDAAVKPLKDHVETIQANQAAKDKAELDGLVQTIIKANILDEDAAKELTLNAARALAAKAAPGKAAALNGAFGDPAPADEFADYDPNAAINAAAKEG